MDNGGGGHLKFEKIGAVGCFFQFLCREIRVGKSDAVGNRARNLDLSAMIRPGNYILHICR